MEITLELKIGDEGAMERRWCKSRKRKFPTKVIVHTRPRGVKSGYWELTFLPEQLVLTGPGRDGQTRGRKIRDGKW